MKTLSYLPLALAIFCPVRAISEDGMRSYNLHPSSIYFLSLPWEVSGITNVTHLFRTHCPETFSTNLTAQYYSGQFFVSGPTKDLRAFDSNFGFMKELRYEPVLRYKTTVRLVELHPEMSARIVRDFLCFTVASGGFIEYNSLNTVDAYAIKSLTFSPHRNLDIPRIDARISFVIHTESDRNCELPDVPLDLGKEITLLEWSIGTNDSSRFIVTVECDEVEDALYSRP